jgi:hypothetical protein
MNIRPTKLDLERNADIEEERVSNSSDGIGIQATGAMRS